MDMGIQAMILVGALAAGTLLPAAPPSVSLSERLARTVPQDAVRRSDPFETIGVLVGGAVEVVAVGNTLSPGRAPAAGKILTIDHRHVVPDAAASGVDILINIPQRLLFRLDGDVAHSFPVAVGRPNWRTPVGTFHVISREKNPIWNVPISIQAEMRRSGQRVITRMPPGPRNPLGKYWIGLSLASLGIHGTPHPSSISRFATHGCVRMHPRDIEALFADVTEGMTGAIVYEPVLLAGTADGIFLEAHGDPYRRGRASLDEVKRVAAAMELETRIKWPIAAQVLKRHEGVARRID